MQDIYLLVGVPAAGKSWILSRSASNYECLPHDAFIKEPTGSYIGTITRVAHVAPKPLLIEAPFSMAQIMEPLLDRGLRVIPIFVFADEPVLRGRYKERGRNEESIICGHLHRQRTFQSRVAEHKAFAGTSQEVLNHLNLLATERHK